MKKVIVATIAMAAIGTLIAGCGEPQAAAINRTQATVEPVSYVIEPVTDDELLDKATHAVYVGTGTQIMQGLADAADLSAALNQIEEARQALHELEEQSRAATMVIGIEIMQGLADSNELGDALQGIQIARQAILAKAGLADSSQQ